jgi:hypothetical protein
MKFERWDIWLASVKFDDSEEEKTRPVIILGDNTALVLALYVTSASPRPGYNDYPLADWESAGLKKRSTVRLDFRLQLDSSKIIKRLGRVSDRDRLLLTMRGQIRT